MRATGQPVSSSRRRKIWKDPRADADNISEYQGFWQSFGIEIVSLQSLLCRRLALTQLFAGVETRTEMLRYLTGMIRLALRHTHSMLGVQSPSNRQRHGLSDDAAEEIAVPFFRSLAAEGSEGSVV